MRLTEEINIPQQRRSLFIIAAPLVDGLQKLGFPLPQPPIRFYPDGSLWSDDYEVLRWARQPASGIHKNRNVLGVEQFIQNYLPGGYASTRFRGLGAFGRSLEIAPQYHGLYSGACTWMGEYELGALMYPGIFKEITEDECDLAHVRVLVQLRRKFTAALADELAGILRQWFTDIGSKGVFGEAGLTSISPSLRWLGKCAGFELDATGSGQETLNTLYLAVLNWGMNQKRPLVLTDLTPDKSEPVFSSNQTVPLT